MRTRVIAVLVALLATFALTAPGTAQAAGCGSSFDQWVGTYTGTYFYEPWWEAPDTYALRVELTSVASGSLRSVTTVDGQGFPQQEAPKYGTDGIFTWTTAATYPQRYFADEVSCAGGGVSSATGEIWAYDGPPYGWIPIGRYELARGA